MLAAILYAIYPEDDPERSNYQLDRCFHEIHDASFGDKFVDLVGPDGFNELSSYVFWWLINIRPGYLVFRQGNSYTLEPYMPYRFD